MKPNDFAFSNPHPGLTKREYAAIHIMAQIAASKQYEIWSPEYKAEKAVQYADAIIKELSSYEVPIKNNRNL